MSFSLCFGLAFPLFQSFAAAASFHHSRLVIQAQEKGVACKVRVSFSLVPLVRALASIETVKEFGLWVVRFGQVSVKFGAYYSMLESSRVCRIALFRSKTALSGVPKR